MDSRRRRGLALRDEDERCLPFPSALSSQNIREILNGSALGSLSAAGLAILFQLREIPFAVAFTAWILAAVLTIASRLVLYRILVHPLRRHGRNLRPSLILGSGTRAESVLGLVKGFRHRIPRPRLRRRGPALDWEARSGLPYLGSLDTSQDPGGERGGRGVRRPALRSHYDATAAAIGQCEEQGVLVRLPLDIFLPAFSKQYVDRVNGRPIFTGPCRRRPLSGLETGPRHRRLEHPSDSPAASSSSAILIKRDSPGPVFFVQERVGLNKRTFQLFRSSARCKSRARR